MSLIGLQGLYTYGIVFPGRVTGVAWHEWSGIGVRGVLGSIPGEPPLLMVSVSNEISKG